MKNRQGMFLYEVLLKGGQTHKKFATFLVNAGSLNAKSPDVSGISSVCLVAHSQDAKTIHLLLADGMGSHAKDIVIKEITAKSLKSGGHRIYTDLVDNYFRPYNQFHNL